MFEYIKDNDDKLYIGRPIDLLESTCHLNKHVSNVYLLKFKTLDFYPQKSITICT